MRQITIALAIVTVLAGPVAAQSTAKPFPPGFMKNLAQQMQSQNKSWSAGMVSGNGESNIGNMSPGFHQVHATNCVTLALGGGNELGCVFSQEGLYMCIMNPQASDSSTMAAAYANGNLIGFNIIDTESDANLIISYPVK